MSWAFEEVVESCFREGVLEKARDVNAGAICCLLVVAGVNDVVVRHLAQM